MSTDIPDLIAGALGVSRGTAYDMMREALAEQQEPVAWLVYAKGSRRYFTLTFDVEKVPEIYKGGEAVPLHTSPSAQRKPLTDEQANDIMEKESWGPDAITLNHQLLRTIRRTEAAHGIKGQP